MKNRGIPVRLLLFFSFFAYLNKIDSFHSSSYSLKGQTVTEAFLLSPVTIEKFFSYNAKVELTMFTAFFVRTNGKLIALPFDEVLYITAKNNYCEIVTVKKKFLVHVSLNCFEEKLPENIFCRVHRSHIVAIQKVSSLDHNHLEVGGQTFPINKAGFDAISRRILFICGESGNKQRPRIEEIEVKEYLQKIKKHKKDD
jgi:hypothetical protein